LRILASTIWGWFGSRLPGGPMGRGAPTTNSISTSLIHAVVHVRQPYITPIGPADGKLEHKDEMKDFKAFVLGDIEELRADRKAMNKKWGELAMKDDNKADHRRYMGM
jgi:hypothetical protein